MALCFNPATKHLTPVGQASEEGYRPFVNGDLIDLTNSLQPGSKVLADAHNIAELVAKFFAQEKVYEYVPDQVFCNLFESFCKRSVELLHENPGEHTFQAVAIQKIKRAFIESSITYKRVNTARENFVKEGTRLALDTGEFAGYLTAYEADRTSRLLGIDPIDIISQRSRNAIVYNSFLAYCSTNPSSFLNTVCLIAAKRKAVTHEAQAKVLQQVLSEYFGKTNLSRFLYGKQTLGELSLAEVSVLFRNLEQEFNTNLKISYIEFLHVVINDAGIGGPFYHKGFLNLNPVLASYIWLLHAPQNQAAIAQIETLDLRSLGLQILPPEINHFTGLNDLDLGNNQITEINDLHGLSNLTCLDVYGNGLEEISLSGLSRLRILVLNSGNKLSELNLSGLTNLETLYIGSNPELTELDLDGLKALKMIYVDEIQETKYAEGAFVLKNHPNLEAIEVTSNI